uniref:Uncharacterized protein n=1 Tax=Tanacetum cinerariifolium TaxID=118510 RepID=A0A6L2MUQ1_TANCI|nr:hypothetical protein [Tanacetum cinerariifolium]
MVKTSSSSKNEPCCSKACKKNTEILNSKITQLTDKLSDRENMLYHYKLGLAQVEERLAELRNRELKYCFQTASKDLDSLLESQRLDKNKGGLGYSAVPPPHAQLYSPPKKDLSWTGLPEFKDDTVTDYSRPLPTTESSPDDAQNRNPSVTATEASPCTISPKPFIKFVKAADCTEVKTNKVVTARKSSVRYAEMYKRTLKSPNRVQRLERELQVRTLIHKVDRGRSRSVMAWVPKKRVAPAEEFALLVKIILSQRCINVSQRHINNSQHSCDSYARMVPTAAKVKE